MTFIVMNGRTPADPAMAFYKERVIAVDYQLLAGHSSTMTVNIYLENAVKLSSQIPRTELDHLLGVLGT